MGARFQKDQRLTTRQGGNDVNHVIDRLSDIEHDAGAIMDGANARKKEIAKEMADKTAAFDAQLEQETAGRIQALREEMERSMQKRLAELKAEADAQARQLEETYEARHTDYARQLFQAVTKG